MSDLQVIATLIMWRGYLTPSELSSIMHTRDLKTEDIQHINQYLKGIGIKIERAPNMLLSNKRPYAYVAVSRGKSYTESPIDFNELTFILCFIYVSNQRGNLKLLEESVLLPKLKLYEKDHWIELDTRKNLVSWGIKATAPRLCE